MNIRDIAALANTSVATVSRVINCDEHVSPAMRSRVLAILKETGYKPNLVEKALNQSRRGEIMVLLPTPSNPYYARVLEGVDIKAGEAGYDLHITITHRSYETEKHYLGLLRQQRFDGAVLFTSALSHTELDEMAAAYPVVQCGAYASGPHVSHTCIDNVAAAKEAVGYLLELGSRQIGFLNGRFGRAYEQDRLEGYRQALTAHGCPFEESYIVLGDYTHLDGYEGCKKLMALPKPPNGIFCCCDQVAAGAIKYLWEQGLTPGKDVDVIGFDGTYLSELCTPALTTVEQPAFEMGKTAFDLLFERMQNQKSLTKKVVMPHKLIVRGSTRPTTSSKEAL